MSDAKQRPAIKRGRYSYVVRDDHLRVSMRGAWLSAAAMRASRGSCLRTKGAESEPILFCLPSVGMGGGRERVIIGKSLPFRMGGSDGPSWMGMSGREVRLLDGVAAVPLLCEADRLRVKLFAESGGV